MRNARQGIVIMGDDDVEKRDIYDWCSDCTHIPETDHKRCFACLRTSMIRDGIEIKEPNLFRVEVKDDRV
jgi:hypothetical protein